MKKKGIYIILLISVLMNVILLCVLVFGKCRGTENEPDAKGDMTIEQVNEKARQKIKEYVCSILYIPESYDPVDLRVDSAFYGIHTEPECVKAALDLIDYRRAYNEAESTYEEKLNDIKTFGSTGVFRHLAVERDNAKSAMEQLEPKIEKCESILRSRDTSHDGTFVGWFVYNRYRAKTNSGNVQFNEVYVLYDMALDRWIVQYELDNTKTGNIEQLKELFEEFKGQSVTGEVK